MSPPAFLLRCLLIVAFCLDGSLSLWMSSAMAAERVEHLADSDLHPPTAVDDDCGDVAGNGGGGDDSSHEACDCSTGAACGCACVFPVAAMTHAVPFLARHVLAVRPPTTEFTAVPRSTATPVFRPPIG
jgi:hypothetical protein